MQPNDTLGGERGRAAMKANGYEGERLALEDAVCLGMRCAWENGYEGKRRALRGAVCLGMRCAWENGYEGKRRAWGCGVLGRTATRASGVLGDAVCLGERLRRQAVCLGMRCAWENGYEGKRRAWGCGVLGRMATKVSGVLGDAVCLGERLQGQAAIEKRYCAATPYGAVLIRAPASRTIFFIFRSLTLAVMPFRSFSEFSLAATRFFQVSRFGSGFV